MASFFKKRMEDLRQMVVARSSIFTLRQHQQAEILARVLLAISTTLVSIAVLQQFIWGDWSKGRAVSLFFSGLATFTAHRLAVAKRVSLAVGLLAVYGYGAIFFYAIALEQDGAGVIYYVALVVMFASLFFSMLYALGVWAIGIVSIVLYSLVSPYETAQDLQNVLIYNLLAGIVIVTLTYYRQKAELIRQSEVQEARLIYETLFKSLREGVLVFSLDGKVTMANDSAGRILGAPASDLVGLSIYDNDWYGYHEDGTPYLREDHPAATTLQRGQCLHDQVLGIQRPDGVMVWVSVNTEPLRHAGESHHYAAIASFTDITARRQATLDLQESHRTLERISRAVPDSIYVYDVRTRKNVYLNHAVTGVLGYHAEEIIAMEGQILKHVLHEDDIPRYARHTNKLKRAKDDEVLEFECRVRHKDGRWRWFLTRETVFKRDSDGKTEQVIGVAQDITEKRTMQERAIQLTLERERVLMLSDFVRDASHEFRTPLSIISSNVYLMTRLDDPNLRAHRATMIEEQVISIAHLLDMLLLMSRLDSDISLTLGLTDVNLLLTQIIAPFQVESHKLHHHFVLELDDTLNVILADGGLLQEALAQIVNNAARYSPNSAPITIYTKRNENGISISIRDEGIGLSEADRKRIFERFYRGDKAHSTRGFGLGLPIAHKVIELHGGTLTLVGEEGKGTTCHITLPLILKEKDPDKLDTQTARKARNAGAS
jgi:PAS domain S-box-containing protein